MIPAAVEQEECGLRPDRRERCGEPPQPSVDVGLTGAEELDQVIHDLLIHGVGRNRRRHPELLQVIVDVLAVLVPIAAIEDAGLDLIARSAFVVVDHA